MDYTGRAALDKGFSTTYSNHYRLGGLKITLDGSPQGRTAWRTVPYVLPPDGQKLGYEGYPAIPDTKQVEAYLDEAFSKGWPVKVHANGDAAIDQLFEALRPVVAKHGVQTGTGDAHPRPVHPTGPSEGAPVARHLPVDVSDAHLLLGRLVQADRRAGAGGAGLSPMRSILNTGLHATSHTDAPVVLPNLMQVVWATVNRTSRSGAVIGPDERVTPYEAMKMVTLWGAEQFGEQATKGSIKEGKLADLVVLSDNPITMDQAKINQVLGARDDQGRQDGRERN